MDHLLEFFHSENDDDILDIDLKMIQDWLVVARSSKLYTVYTVLFNEYEVVNVAVTNYMPHYSMSAPNKATAKLANGNTGYSKVIEIILCCFTKCTIIYPVGPAYYCLVHFSSTIQLGAFRFCIGFQKVTYEPFENCDFVDPQSCSWRSL